MLRKPGFLGGADAVPTVYRGWKSDVAHAELAMGWMYTDPTSPTGFSIYTGKRTGAVPFGEYNDPNAWAGRVSPRNVAALGRSADAKWDLCPVCGERVRIVALAVHKDEFGNRYFISSCGDGFPPVRWFTE